METEKLVLDFIEKGGTIKKVRTGQIGCKENKNSIILEKDLPPSFDPPSYLMMSDLKNIV